MTKKNNSIYLTVSTPKNPCIKCGSPTYKGYCADETCPFSDKIRKRDFIAQQKELPLHIPNFNPPIPNMANPKVAAKVKAFIQKQKADAKIRALKDLVKELKKDAKRKHAEIEAFKRGRK